MNNKNDALAPLVIFTYRRIPDKLFESLLKNKLINETEIFVYSDGNKNENDLNDVLRVRKFLKNFKDFKSISIIGAEFNKGLANSIIEGVTEIINKYGKIIVLEDDLIVASDFLEFMNESLNFFENNKNIWSISGYCPDLPCLTYYKKDIFLSVRASSWGWATWKNRWEMTDWQVKDFIELKKNKDLIKEFETGGNDLFKMLELQMLGKIDSWAIRWCYSQFKNKMYTVYPIKSKIINEGFSDGLGTHNTSISHKWETEFVDKKIILEDVKIDDKIIKCFKKYHDLSIATKIGYFARKYGGYSFAKKIYNYYIRIANKYS